MKKSKSKTKFDLESLKITQMRPGKHTLLLVDAQISPQGGFSDINEIIKTFIDHNKNKSRFCVCSTNKCFTKELDWDSDKTKKLEIEMNHFGNGLLESSLAYAIDEIEEREEYCNCRGEDFYPTIIIFTNGYSVGPTYKYICKYLNDKEKKNRINIYTVHDTYCDNYALNMLSTKGFKMDYLTFKSLIDNMDNFFPLSQGTTPAEIKLNLNAAMESLDLSHWTD